MLLGLAGDLQVMERILTPAEGHASELQVAEIALADLLASTAGKPEAGYVKDHWGVESLHWLRDTTYREDTSRAHPIRPQNLRVHA